MTPQKLTNLITSLHGAADIVDAMHDPELQRRHGWDLADWTYEVVPWGVRFIHRDPALQAETVILARLTVDPAQDIISEATR